MLDQIKKRAKDAEQRDALLVKNAQNASNTAQKRLRSSEAQLHKTKIHATLGGTVSYAQKNGVKTRVGDSVRRGQALLSIYDKEKMVASDNVVKADAEKIHLDQTVKLTFTQIPGLQLHGKISNMSIQGEGQGYLVEIMPDGSDNRIKNGMVVHAEIGSL